MLMSHLKNVGIRNSMEQTNSSPSLQGEMCAALGGPEGMVHVAQLLQSAFQRHTQQASTYHLEYADASLDVCRRLTWSMQTPLNNLNCFAPTVKSVCVALRTW